MIFLLLVESGTAWFLDGAALVYGSTPALNLVRHGLIGLDYLLYGTLDDFFFLYLIASVQVRRTLSERYLQNARKLFRVLLTVSVLSGIVFFSSFWTGSIFMVDAYGGINVTTGYLLLTIIGSLGEIASIILVLRERKTLGLPKTLISFCYLLIPIPLIYVDVTYGLTTPYEEHVLQALQSYGSSD